ncbi:MAG: hypothetical protein UV67_C0018G0006 [Parcubacteria group bacterium GW2011_GWC1_43_12]|nr:MAG: hypothetical protein UV34_C0008G0010 [Parcubacteria group bacterium GW2011_GWB1_42_6]KKS91788.1 MAG: hypothetical protein UV67_C0018G0006 [Parcubacteria group bacterium GW2011_GWC1_43_12]
MEEKMSKERQGEIALALVRQTFMKEPFRFSPGRKRQIGDEAKLVGLKKEELLDFYQIIIFENFDKILSISLPGCPPMDSKRMGEIALRMTEVKLAQDDDFRNYDKESFLRRVGEISKKIKFPADEVTDFFRIMMYKIILNFFAKE